MDTNGPGAGTGADRNSRVAAPVSPHRRHDGGAEVEQPRGLPMLDGLRGVAALLVLLTHCAFATGAYGWGAMGALLARFDFGVALFFVLSGFLLTRPWVAAAAGRPGPDVGRYARHRVARILPAYWVALTVVLWATWDTVSAGAVTSNVLLLQVYTGDLLPHFTQTWSLCTEVAFYAALPLLAPWVLRGWDTGLRRPMARLAALALLAWLVTLLAAGGVLPPGPVVGQWLPAHLDWFAVGMALAACEPAVRATRDLHGHGPVTAIAALASRPLTPVATALLLIGISATPLGGPLTLSPSGPVEAVAKEMLYAAAAGLLVATAAFAKPRGALGVLATRPLRWTGRISYAVFLWHLLVLSWVMDILGIGLFEGQFILVALLTAVTTFVLAEASWWAVERPVLKWVGARTRV